MTQADIEQRDLRCANCYKSILKGLDLSGAYLCAADLRGANLIAVDVKGAFMHRASIEEMSMSGEEVTEQGDMGGGTYGLHGALPDNASWGRDTFYAACLITTISPIQLPHHA